VIFSGVVQAANFRILTRSHEVEKTKGTTFFRKSFVTSCETPSVLVISEIITDNLTSWMTTNPKSIHR